MMPYIKMGSQSSILDLHHLMRQRLPLQYGLMNSVDNALHYSQLYKGRLNNDINV